VSLRHLELDYLTLVLVDDSLSFSCVFSLLKNVLTFVTGPSSPFYNPPISEPIMMREYPIDMWVPLLMMIRWPFESRLLF